MRRKKVDWTNLMGSIPNPADEVVIKVGSLKFTRREMVVALSITNFIAAKNLTRILDDMAITSVRELSGTRIDDVKANGAGTWTLFVACVLIAWKGYDYERWIAGETGDVAKLSTVVRRDYSETRKAA